MTIDNLYETIEKLVRQYAEIDSLLTAMDQSRPPERVNWPAGVSSQHDIDNYQRAIAKNDEERDAWEKKYSESLSMQSEILALINNEIPETLRDVSIRITVGDKRIRVLKSWNEFTGRLETYVYC